MSSNRLKNDPSHYKCEQSMLQHKLDWTTYVGKTTPSLVAVPQQGINMGSIPSDKMVSNYVDVDSYLKGINGCNLVNPRAAPVPNVTKLPEATFYDKEYEVSLPKPLVIEKDQRFMHGSW